MLRKWSLSLLAIAAALLVLMSCSPTEEGGTEKKGETAKDASAKSGRPGSEGAQARGGDSSAREGRGGRGSGRRGRGGPGGPGGPGGSFGSAEPAGESGVPVEVATVTRGSISSFFETNSTLEAEKEVDLVARVAGPIVALNVEEGDRIRQGQLLAKLDDRELRTQLEAAEVRLEEARASFQRTQSLFEQELVSRDVFDQARAGAETSRADAERLRVQLDYTAITAPFSGRIVERYVKFAEFVQNGARLFRLSDFDPLLAPIQVPERHLQRLAVGQRAQLQVEAFGERLFEASVLRIRPVVDADSGTIEVTLQVRGQGDLRPGMFSSVELEMERREEVLLVPKAALALDSLQPTVFVAARGQDGEVIAARRELDIGLRNDRFLEVRSGLEAGEDVVTIGQDGLADGTPLELAGAGEGAGAEARGRGGSGDGEGRRGPPRAEAGGAGGDADAGRRGEGRRGMPGFLMDMDWNDPEQVEKLKERLRERGLSDAEIEQRLERMKRRFSGGDQRSGGRGPGS